ncbi:PucR family transcriptional regulator [Metabacillus arenae]|uniref:PucR family transcriptional regulator n=1 Tax=Metabacillus arenae TaxID=2771434 RepID=A0A926RWJ2_9BACI|nr:PucR family transcriptional regulator [Metabacillus arenae]MBD1380853.1 PucR family transcriptional regulator [Metabacillus arenae]
MTQHMNDPFKYHFDRLEDVADRISEVLQCPITIEDVNHRLLAYSTHDDCTDPARISTIIGRRVPEKVINSLWKDGTIPKLLKTDEPIRVKQIDEVGLGNRIAISIWKNNEVLGFIWALEIQKALIDEELQLLKSAAKAVKNKLLNLQVRKTKKVERNQEFFWKILTGNIQTIEEMKIGFQQIQLQPPNEFSVVLLKFNDAILEKTEKQLTYLLETTQQVQVLLTTVDFDEFVILISPKSNQPLADVKQFLQSIYRQLQERFMIHDVKISTGGLYRNLPLIEKSYKEALSVLEVKAKFPEETKELFSFPELGIYQYLDILYEKRKQEHYMNYSLAKLADYDQAHHTDLVETLEVFLDCDSNVNRAAKKINVHINTLSYRLKRISQIGEIDIQNPNEKITIYLDMKLSKLSL